jgi:hypothetical protein
VTVKIEPLIQYKKKFLFSVSFIKLFPVFRKHPTMFFEMIAGFVTATGVVLTVSIAGASDITDVGCNNTLDFACGHPAAEAASIGIMIRA